MINKSLWLKGIKNNKVKALKSTLYTDVLIIGGGITGISCAYHLMNKSLKVTVIDQGHIAHGVTANTTGKLTYLQDITIPKIENVYGNEYTNLYIKSQIEAIELVKNIIINNNINCNYESNSSYLYTNDKKSINKIKKIANILKRNNIPFKERENLPIKFPYTYGIKVDNTAVFHPVKYVRSLRTIIEESGIEIYENTNATSFEKLPNGYMVTANNQKIFTNKLVICCHYPFFMKPFLMPLKTYLEKSYITAGKIDKSRKFNAINIDSETHSIRYFSDKTDYLIYCSESRPLGKNMDNIENYSNIFWKTKANLNDNIKYHWFNYDLMTLDGMPLIGYLEKDNKNLLIGTGFNTWGMTNGSIAGKVLSDLIQNIKNPYEDIFNPNRRFNIMKIFSTINYNFKNMSSLIASKLFIENNPDNRVKVVEVEGIKYGIYTDEKNIEHKVLNTCPHLKCSLIFNDTDKTWDCPCHGSRFNINGSIVKGPSVYSIKIDKN